ncbi:hypothetical protein J6590_067392 [Homalodisca vitripennis]|nr:hypothetical protein J6590_067392 [Homalodisca vitripennis]
MGTGIKGIDGSAYHTCMCADTGYSYRPEQGGSLDLYGPAKSDKIKIKPDDKDTVVRATRQKRTGGVLYKLCGISKNRYNFTMVEKVKVAITRSENLFCFQQALAQASKQNTFADNPLAAGEHKTNIVITREQFRDTVGIAVIWMQNTNVFITSHGNWRGVVSETSDEVTLITYYLTSNESKVVFF